MDVAGQGSGSYQPAANGDTRATTACAPGSCDDADGALSVLAGGRIAGHLIEAHVSQLVAPSPPSSPPLSASVPGSAAPFQPPPSSAPVASAAEILAVGLAALDVFLQANVTGPVLAVHRISSVENRFVKAWKASHHGTDNDTRSATMHSLRKACLAHLEVDGVSPYAHIPHLELFSLARHVFLDALAGQSQRLLEAAPPFSSKYSVAWLMLRINVWHYKLLTQPNLGSGSNFIRSSQWSDVPTLASAILDSMDTLLAKFSGDAAWSATDLWSRQEKAEFLVEAANNYILLGHDDRARATLRDAARASGLVYALSGALGKRTKFQDKSTSQLVVLARNGTEQHGAVSTEDGQADVRPGALQLNNDTLLEDIHFVKDDVEAETDKTGALPPSLAHLSPDDQPQLSSVDQIILLTEATLRDAFSPADTLTSEQVLPFAVRVLAEKSTNWQIYTQALLVRSRIEIHRSRTVERGVLQLQAVADQVVNDTSGTVKQPTETPNKDSQAADVPAIQVTAPGQDTATINPQIPTSFLPAPKASESAPAHVRLRHIHALSTPPRWHLESELAYAWVGVGSLTSALEIFRRLHMWAEVALCLASRAAVDDEDGRGSGGEEKAKAIIRWRLFHRTGESASASTGSDDEGGEDVARLKAIDYAGCERHPPPSNAARLWCILGDLEDNPDHYHRAWNVSKHRYARAQKSLGEYFLRQKDWHKAHAAYKMATAVNRLIPEMWSRLGDISLRLGQFEEAAEAYSRSIGSATGVEGGESAKTWSNLGSALWSLYCEVIAEANDGDVKHGPDHANADDDEDGQEVSRATGGASRIPGKLLLQSLTAYKKGASIAHDNWRIWDNVLTIASRIRPPPASDMVLAFQHMVRIRRTEQAIDADVLSALLHDVVLVKDRDEGNGIYEPPRGSTERLVMQLLEDHVVPLITQRPELWALMARLRAWRRDYAGAIDASERAWRAAVGASGTGGAGLLPGESASASAPADWTADEAAWADVVARTDELVSALQNWGPRAAGPVGPRWRAKARSAVRSVMGRAREPWEGSDGWKTLEAMMEGLKGDW